MLSTSNTRHIPTVIVTPSPPKDGSSTLTRSHRRRIIRSKPNPNEDIPHLLDPSYSGLTHLNDNYNHHSSTHGLRLSSSPSSYSSRPSLYRDPDGNLHDADYPIFAVTKNLPQSTHKRKRRSSHTGLGIYHQPSLEGFDSDTDDDEFDAESDYDPYSTQQVAFPPRQRRPSSPQSYPPYPYSYSPSSYSPPPPISLPPQLPSLQVPSDRSKRSSLTSSSSSPSSARSKLRFLCPVFSKEKDREKEKEKEREKEPGLDSEHASFQSGVRVRRDDEYEYGLGLFEKREEQEEVRLEEEEEDLEEDLDDDVASISSGRRRNTFSNGESHEDRTPTCSEVMRRQWESTILALRLGLFRTKRRVQQRLGLR